MTFRYINGGPLDFEFEYLGKLETEFVNILGLLIRRPGVIDGKN
jgi:hypothetical protein